MPELPEVETTTRLLRPALVGRKLRGAQVLWPRTLVCTAEDADRAVRGTRIAAVGRRGKFVVVDLERRGRAAGHLVVHLRMTGRLFVESRSVPDDPWLRARFPLDGGEELRFTDARKFGRIWCVRELIEVTRELGPEPLSDQFTAELLHGALAARRRRLKPLLLDQTFLAGLGNIYVDEALFRARLHPLARSERIDRDGARRLWTAIRETLTRAIEREGSSFDASYRTPEGRPGGYQDEFRVYDRAGRPCTRCSTPIARIVVGQRGTHLCPSCQPRTSRSSRRSLQAGASATKHRASRPAATAARTTRGRR